MNCVNWSADGRLLVCGGEDRIVRVFSRRRAEFANVSCFNMSQGSPIVGVHFLKADGYDVIIVLWFIQKNTKNIINSVKNWNFKKYLGRRAFLFSSGSNFKWV